MWHQVFLLNTNTFYIDLLDILTGPPTGATDPNQSGVITMKR